MQLTMFIDSYKCIGCYSCIVACKLEHNLPPHPEHPPLDNPKGPELIRVYQVGPQIRDGEVHHYFQPVSCKHCLDAPCIEACPCSAIYKDIETDINHTFGFSDSAAKDTQKVSKADVNFEETMPLGEIMRKASAVAALSRDDSFNKDFIEAIINNQGKYNLATYRRAYKFMMSYVDFWPEGYTTQVILEAIRNNLSGEVSSQQQNSA